MVTAYDYPSALHVDLANIDIILVGDSLGMVELGYETTQVCGWVGGVGGWVGGWVHTTPHHVTL